MTVHDVASCKSTLKKLLKDKKSLLFRAPVDPVKAGALDYFDVIRNPMDLATMGHKLAAGLYPDRYGFRDDFKLIVSNAKLYNGSQSPIGALADDLDFLFDRQWERVEATLRALESRGDSSYHSHQAPKPIRPLPPPPPPPAAATYEQNHYLPPAEYLPPPPPPSNPHSFTLKIKQPGPPPLPPAPLPAPTPTPNPAPVHHTPIPSTSYEAPPQNLPQTYPAMPPPPPPLPASNSFHGSPPPPFPPPAAPKPGGFKITLGGSTVSASSSPHPPPVPRQQQPTYSPAQSPYATPQPNFSPRPSPSATPPAYLAGTDGAPNVYSPAAWAPQPIKEKKKKKDKEGKEKKPKPNYAEPSEFDPLLDEPDQLVPVTPQPFVYQAPGRPAILDDPMPAHPTRWQQAAEPVDIKKAKQVLSKVQGIREAFFFLLPVEAVGPLAT